MIIFRITDNSQYTEEELQEFSNKNPELKMIKEYKTYNPPQGAHFHGWTDEEVSPQAIAVRLKQQLNCIGNKDYSVGQKELKENDGPEGYKHYCCKSCEAGNIPGIYYNLTEEEVMEYHKQYWIKNKQLNDAKKTKKDKSQKDELFTYCTQLNPKDFSEEELIPLILNYFRENDKMVSNSQVENYYYYISSKMNPLAATWRARIIIQKMARL